MKEVNTPNCERENDLIGFLYGELNESEARAFEQHLHECKACDTDFASFRKVRKSVVDWRNESLSSIGLSSPVTVSSPTKAAEATPSAIAALREFFKLSPLWMKGAVAFAAILLFVFGGLALSRLQDKPPTALDASTQSPQELNALVEQRVQEELQRIKESHQQSQALVTDDHSQQKSSVKRITRGRSEVASASAPRSRRPLSKTEREQLAADLGLVSAKNDSDLRLLGDTINQ